MRRALTAATLVLALPPPAAAQVSVAGTRDLQFGFVALGVTTTVLPTDPVKSGQWTITGVTGNQVQIRLTAPNQLVGPGGATMPVTFRNGDAFIEGSWTGGSPSYFNPNGTKIFKFSGGPQAILRLGGRVTPGTNQRTGAYANTVICTITFLN